MVTSTFPMQSIANTNHLTEMTEARFGANVSEGNVSDFEVARRVSAIRSQWTAKERADRHEEATRRFDALLAVLQLDASRAT